MEKSGKSGVQKAELYSRIKIVVHVYERACMWLLVPATKDITRRFAVFRTGGKRHAAPSTCFRKREGSDMNRLSQFFRKELEACSM